MRLGLDMGTNSIGWWLYEQDDKGAICGTIDAGVRIFSDGRDPKSKASLAVDRREARAMRRRRDRFLRRRAALLKKLAALGLLPGKPPSDKSTGASDPYTLRARALTEKLEPHEIGRALFHLNQRRGFKSNRKADGKNNEGGKIKDGEGRLDQAMMEAGAKTYGEFLAKRRAKAADQRAMPQTRTRLGTVKSGEKEVSGYDYYPTRKHYEEEFNKICEAQAEHHPDLLNDKTISELFEIIFYQRPLKPPKIGRCLYEEEDRLPKAHPLFQQRRLYETLNALRIQTAGQPDQPITVDQRKALILKLRDKKSIAFSSLKKAIKLNSQQRFSIESDRRDKLEGDEIRASFSDKKRFGNKWPAFDADEQWKIIKKLIDTEDPDELHQWLTKNYQLTDEQAEAIAKAKLPNGYGKIGLTATKKILAELKSEDEIVTYDEAVKRADDRYHHSDERTGENFNALPYYGELLQRHVIPGSFDKSQHDPVKDAPEYWGRITNPTVHIALGQLRHLVNDLIKVYGKPAEIVVELGRDLKNSVEKKKEIEKTIKENTEAAIERGKKIEDILGEKGNTGRNRAIMRIWEAQGALVKKCPYCCETIGIESLYNGSTDIDHILPYSKTLDDGIANKVVAHAECNKWKGNRTPYEAWAGTPQWDDIVANLKNLPKGAQWRFGPDAMERFEGEKNFEDRQLTDMQYIARITRAYLSFLYPEKGKGSSHVWSVAGKLTEMLRRKWGLNELLADAENYDTHKKKNRQDHRHHAIDAAVIAATDRGLVKHIADVSAKGDKHGVEKAAEIKAPYDGFREDIKNAVGAITVSHRVDHGSVKADDPSQTAAQLHNDTAYGLTGAKSLSGADIVAYRKPFLNLTEKDISKIRDSQLQADLYPIVSNLKGKELTEALTKFSKESRAYRGIRRVRLEDSVSVIAIKDKEGKAYKGYKGDSNHCVEVWRLPDGKWKAEVLSTFDAHKSGLGSTRPHPAAKLVMRLLKKDIVLLEHPDAGLYTGVIAKFNSANGLYLSKLFEANVDARHRDKNDPLKYLQLGPGRFQKYKLRKIGVDRLGRISDPGFSG